MKSLIFLSVIAVYAGVTTASIERAIEGQIENLMKNSLRGAMNLADAQSPKDSRNLRNTFSYGGNNIMNKFQVRPIRMSLAGSPNINYPMMMQNPYANSRAYMISKMMPSSPFLNPSIMMGGRMPIMMGGGIPMMTPYSMYPFNFGQKKNKMRGPKNVNVNLKFASPADAKKQVEGQTLLVSSGDNEREANGEVNAKWETDLKEVVVNGIKNETRVKTFHNTGKIHATLGSENEYHKKLIKTAKVKSGKKVNSVYSRRNLFEKKDKKPEEQNPKPISPLAMNSQPLRLLSPVPIPPQMNPFRQYPVPPMQPNTVPSEDPAAKLAVQGFIGMQRPMNNPIVGHMSPVSQPGV